MSESYASRLKKSQLLSEKSRLSSEDKGIFVRLYSFLCPKERLE